MSAMPETVRPSKDAILSALHAFVSQRSGIELGNYGTRESFLEDYRSILRDGRHARAMLAEARFGDVTDYLHLHLQNRLTLEWSTDGTLVADYVTGQYFPTEYRAAVCRALASAFWSYWRASYPDMGADAIRDKASRTFGRGIANRWFR